MNPRKDRAACGRSRCVSCSGTADEKDISKSDINTKGLSQKEAASPKNTKARLLRRAGPWRII